MVTILRPWILRDVCDGKITAPKPFLQARGHQFFYDALHTYYERIRVAEDLRLSQYKKYTEKVLKITGINQ